MKKKLKEILISQFNIRRNRGINQSKIRVLLSSDNRTSLAEEETQGKAQ